MRTNGKRTQSFLMAAALLLLTAQSEAAPTGPSCSKPDWPTEARRYELEGTTTLGVVVGDDGRPASATVQKSSGWRLLDKAALEGVSRCVFPKSASDGKAKSAQFVWRLGGEPIVHPSLVEGSCPPSERFEAFKSLDKSPSDANGVLLRMLVKNDGAPWNVKAEASGLPPEVLEAAAAYIQSCRFAAKPDAEGKRTDTTYGKLLLKN
jgi:periplasmic protein TonB